VLGLAVDANGAAVRGIEAIKDRHQGRLAGTVLANDAVNGAAANGEIDVPIGVDRPETLVDLFELDGPLGRARCGCSGPGGPLLMVAAAGRHVVAYSGQSLSV